MYLNVVIVIFSVITFFVPTIAVSRALIQIERADGQTSNGHIVQLRPGTNLSSVFDSTNIVATHNWTVINGFTGKFTEDELSTLHAHDDVESIAEDGIGYGTRIATQTNAPWGLARLSSVTKLSKQNPRDLNFKFIHETTAGKGVDIYVVDTGVFLGHGEFGDRARWGATFGGYKSEDGSGHGTHCAGIAAGKTVGIAKEANIIAVKVLGDDNRGRVSNFISGVNWVYNQARVSRRPSVASISLSTDNPSVAFDMAVTSLTKIGVHVVVGAGNNNVNAGTISPARAPGAITVGASNIGDARASFSNWGSRIDIFAPGQDIISAGITNPNALSIISGTSVAAPHVTGLVAYLISRSGNTDSVTMRNKIKNLAVDGILTDIPRGTVNQLAQNGLA